MKGLNWWFWIVLCSLFGPIKQTAVKVFEPICRGLKILLKTIRRLVRIVVLILAFPFLMLSRAFQWSFRNDSMALKIAEAILQCIVCWFPSLNWLINVFNFCKPIIELLKPIYNYITEDVD